MTTSRDKIAGAPISWGVCEVPGWGYQLSPDRVLTEMQQVGLAATEFGPDGFLPADPAVMADFLASRHLTAVGGFTPVVLHEASHDPVPGIDRLLDSYDASHAGVLVLSAATGQDGYDTRPDLDEAGWTTLLTNLDRLTSLAAARGVRAVLHPHVGTMIERGPEVQRVLEGSAISLCLDTGHLLIGGTDPAELTRQAPDRIAHTHLKDVNDQIAAQVRSGRLTYTEAVGRGMYRPLGRGDVDFAAIVGHLRSCDYGGWYVLEQDTILTEEPRGEGPVTDVRQSADYLRTLLTSRPLSPLRGGPVGQFLSRRPPSSFLVGHRRAQVPPSQTAGPVLADQVLAETVVAVLVIQGESGPLVDAPRVDEHVVGPQGDVGVPRLAGETEHLLDQPGADPEAPGPRLHQQQPQPCGGGVLAHAEHAAGRRAVDLGDPGRLGSGSRLST